MHSFILSAVLLCTDIPITEAKDMSLEPVASSTTDMQTGRGGSHEAEESCTGTGLRGWSVYLGASMTFNSEENLFLKTAGIEHTWWMRREGAYIPWVIVRGFVSEGGGTAWDPEGGDDEWPDVEGIMAGVETLVLLPYIAMFDFGQGIDEWGLITQPFAGAGYGIFVDTKNDLSWGVITIRSGLRFTAYERHGKGGLFMTLELGAGLQQPLIPHNDDESREINGFTFYGNISFGY